MRVQKGSEIMRNQRSSTCSARPSESTRNLVKSGLVAASLLFCNGASGFMAAPRAMRYPSPPLKASVEDEITRQLKRAKEVLAISKAKLEATGNAPADEIPFFATSARMDSSTKREKVTKSRDEETGLIYADGEKMARMSEIEQWEQRSLLEVFESEIDDPTAASKHLAERDVAASIFNLRKQMKTEDYRRIFDTSNYFIGEDT